MNVSKTCFKVATICLILVANLIVMPVHHIFAEDSEPPKPIIEPRLHPSPQPHPMVENNHRIFNELIVPYLPAQSREADIADQGKKQVESGAGIDHVETGLSSGATLYGTVSVCNNFNRAGAWSSTNTGDMWSDHYAGWGTFAVDDGWFYHATNVTFSREQMTGPGNKASNDQYSFKIASNQPYAAGIASPLIAVPPGAAVSVSMKYMIFDHDTRGQDYDLGVVGDKTRCNWRHCVLCEWQCTWSLGRTFT